uniref:WD repeat domain 90 n=1 Tax=Oryzias sinensis TaxID=183150 RepID=A0A8C7XN51_9TELE
MSVVHFEAWQNPYVNIFKHVKIEEWKKSAKEGEVSTFRDKLLKCPVFRISGVIPENSYILIPRNTKQSLDLTGHFFYLLFRPSAGKYFLVHIDVASKEGQIVRISFSNMFREFKFTPTWLQFPFVCGASKGSVYERTAKSATHGLVGRAPGSVRWTCLMLDLQDILSFYLNCSYSHLKRVKLFANMDVKNMFTSDLLLDPGISFTEAKQMGHSFLQGTGPFPREMSFPVPKGTAWHDLYDHIKYAVLPNLFGILFVTYFYGYREISSAHCVNLSRAVQDRVSLIQQITSPKLVRNPSDIQSCYLFHHHLLCFVFLFCFVLQALWTKSGSEVVYPCHAIIISMKISSNQQRFFIGHTDKVSALTFNGSTTVLASAQTGNNSVVRVWDYHNGNCLAIFRNHAHSLSCLSFSSGAAVLCGVGKDVHNKTLVVVWNTLNVRKGGPVTVLAKALTEVDINTMKIAFFDDTRMVSCGRDNIRLWRVRNGTLRSCPVDLGEYRSLDFSDVTFEEGNASHKHVDDRTLFACSRSGHIFEIDYGRVSVKNMRRLLPSQQQHASRREKWTFNTGPGIAINSISVSSSFCATGCEDGFMRLWPLDFSAVFLEAEHEGPVSMVSVSVDSQKVLAVTSTGNLGFLDVSSREYSTLMRSHTDTVLGFSVDGIRRHLTTASADGTLRIWNMDSLHQLFDFASEDSPCSVAFHPHEQTFCCGFTSGIVRVFDISNAKLLAEHRQHKGEVIGLAFSPDGDFMHSADSQGSLALYDASEEDHSVIRLACNVVARGTERAPDALTVSGDSRFLAFVGPSQYIVTIADAQSLDELLHVDVSILDVESPQLDVALKVCFSPASTEHLLIATSANKILWVCTKSGRLLREVSNVHKHQCSSLSVNEDSRFLLTAGHNTVKVWDYNLPLHNNSQMFIGHSQPIRQVGFTPDQMGVVSVGDAIFLWDFLASPRDSPACLKTHVFIFLVLLALLDTSMNALRLSNWMPRQKAPFPSSPPRLDFSAINRDEPAAELHPNKPTRPDCYKHFVPRLKTSYLDQTIVPPQPREEGIKLKAVIGYNGNGRNNMVWSPDQGLFAYTCGCMVVVEYLHTGSQRHLQGHTEEISCLAITNDAQIIASAAGSGDGDKSLICIWDVQNGACSKTISYHRGAVQSLAFSRDDRFFLSVGDFSEPGLALWSSKNFHLLSSANVSGPIHDAAFSPFTADQMACVGSQGVYFCVVHMQGQEIQRMAAPAEVGDVEFAALCYHMDSFLFTSTNRGHVCAWDANTQACVIIWEADDDEIGVLLCGGNRLFAGSSTRRLRVWDIGAMKRITRETIAVEREIMLDGTTISAAFDNTMDMGIVGTTAGTLWYINWSDNSAIRLVSGHKAKVNDAVFSFDESHFATCSEDGSVRVWTTHSYELVVQFQVLNQACGCVCWSPASIKDHTRVAAGYGDGTLRIFQLASTEMEIKMHPHQVAVTAIQYSAHGHVIVSAGKNGLVAVSSPTNGATLRVIRDHKGATITTVQCCKKFGLEGNELWLAAGADRRVSVWAADWTKEKCDLLDWLSFPAPAPSQDDYLPPSIAAFSPEDHSLVVYTGYGVEKELLFYSLSKKQVMTFSLFLFFIQCASQLVAVGSKERVLKLIKSTSGVFQDFCQHSDSVQTCHFSPSGALLFSVAFNEILLWEVQGL